MSNSKRQLIWNIAPLLILLLALFLQMRYLAELRTMFPGGFNQPFCGIDAIAHVNRAESLFDGTMLAGGGNSHFYFIPMYPFYLAALKIFWGDSVLFPIFLQALLQLLGIAALYGLGRMVFSPLTGLLAALGMATYSYYIYYLPCFDQSLLTVPLFTLSIFLILKYRHTNKSGWLPAGGISLSIAILSRPTFLLVLPIVLIWLYITNPQPASPQRWRGMMSISQPRLKIFGKQVILLILPFIITVMPITWHNYRATGRFILISTNLDVNLFTGNNPDATGLDTLAHAQGQPAEIRFRDTIQRVNKGKTTLTAEVIQFITHQPGDWLALTATKTWLWFGETDERLVTPVFPLRVEQSPTLASLPLAWQALVIAALLGLILVRGRSPAQTLFLWLVYGIFSAATIFFFIQLRFRLPLLPFMLLLAASFIASARAWCQHRPQKFWAVLIIFLLLNLFMPSLWIFIALFAGFGLTPDIWSKKRVMSVVALLSLGIYLLMVGWWVNRLQRVTRH